MGARTREILGTPRISEALAGHATQWFPKECCALLFDGPEGPEALLAENLADKYHELDPDAFPAAAERAYVLDPRLIAKAEANGRTLIAIVHSHCRVGAYFSAEDVRAATSPFESGPLFPGVDYVVLDAQEDGVRGFKVFGWSAEAGGFIDV